MMVMSERTMVCMAPKFYLKNPREPPKRPNWARQREKEGSDDDDVYGSWPPYTLSGLPHSQVLGFPLK